MFGFSGGEGEGYLWEYVVLAAKLWVGHDV